ncbi:MAG TPA: prepilin-type N-terminal cleavage/methylation domain-containing protein [Actinoplanes sp.]|nr:prepilin-type N-terminal cleavage/methylation domain-containing protein [Actinoplanes sp.]
MKRLTRRLAGDQGFSLIEVMMAATIMTFVLAIALTGIVQFYSDTNKTQQTAEARDQLDISFRRLDRELRYATWVSTPGKVGTRWYVEYAMPDDAAGDRPCRQIILNNGQLILAAWNLPATASTSQTVLATGVTADTATGPVSVYLPDDRPYVSASGGASGVGSVFKPQYTQVRLRFSVTVGKVALPFDSIFTAQNIDRNASRTVTSDCSKGRPTS